MASTLLADVGRKSGKAIRQLSRAGLDLLYPPRCAVCGRGGSFLCDPCLAALPRAEPPRCHVCWLPVAGRFCPACDAHPLAFAALRSAFRYEGSVRKLVRDFKFRNFSALAEAMAGPMVLAVSDPALTADLIVPIPLSRGGERERGYNQAGLLAKGIAAYLGKPVA